MVEPSLEDVFPGLRGQSYQITSPRDDRYNCIAFAAGDDQNWWWPDSAGKMHGLQVLLGPRRWRSSAKRSRRWVMSSAATIGWNPAMRKSRCLRWLGLPKHACRQLPNGRWASKLGRSEDIEHALHDLTGTAYGKVVLFMKRPIA